MYEAAETITILAILALMVIFPIIHRQQAKLRFGRRAQYGNIPLSWKLTLAGSEFILFICMMAVLSWA